MNTQTNIESSIDKTSYNAKRIGIVVPIYNVEKYLNECLESVKNQTYTNFQAILVDDGSIDSSCDIAMQYIKLDSRFTLIKKPNAGLSSARNVGIEYLKNNYTYSFDYSKSLFDSKITKTPNTSSNTIKQKSVNMNNNARNYLINDVANYVGSNENNEVNDTSANTVGGG
ncbi:glycosyltransferase family 2 protein, partial [Helicobacter muridarum]